MITLNQIQSQQPAAWQPPVNADKSSLEKLFKRQDGQSSALRQCTESFKQYFQKEAGRLSSSMSADSQALFQKCVTERMDLIIKTTLGDVPGKNDIEAFQKQLSNAGERANHALQRLVVSAKAIELRSEPSSTPVRPQVSANGSGGYTLIRSAPQLENLVLRGGGTKGVGYAPALDIMSTGGMLSGLKNIAGTSAGSLMGSCLAAGVTPTQFEYQLSDTIFRPSVTTELAKVYHGLGQQVSDMLHMPGPLKDAHKYQSFQSTNEYPGQHNKLYGDAKLGGGLMTGLSALHAVDNATSASVRDHLNANWDKPAFRAKLDQLPKEQLSRLQMLRQPADFNQSRVGKMVTFSDLKTLHDLAPEKFKNLTVTGWDKKNKTTTYFNAEHSPKMPIAEAARISMSLPLLFKTVQLDPGDGAGKRKFVDGGFGSNMPAEAFIPDAAGKLEHDVEPDRAQAEARARTLLLTFDEQGTAYSILHSDYQQSAPGFFSGERLMSWSANQSGKHQANIADNNKVYNSGPNSLPVFHGELDTVTMAFSDKKKDAATLGAALKALEQMEARGQQAESLGFSSLQDIADVLEPDEKKALLDAPPPKGDSPDRKLYELLAKQQSAPSSRPHAYA
ncbi:patatin-like phospholipase family protein [Chromobacterium violaceum]|uniref:patatin-like phospholipase family protein n=1 Tax=Chromobacterium violaceum TaxID=536 RepID=UPI001BEACE36|nr:patatin-like phospholipase family protein [Chromobacterium violaceum]MBT2869650.1 patatin-like phospholipase family protein [Chromobacterium violaceum]